MSATTTTQATTTTSQPQEQKMKLTTQQASHLNRLFTACGNAKNFDESEARDTRLNNYMEKLMERGIGSQEIVDLLY